MKERKGTAEPAKRPSTASVRATISFPRSSTRLWKASQDKKKVSLAWVVREATEKYVADKWPLLAGTQRRE